jgi:hypothetical protein
MKKTLTAIAVLCMAQQFATAQITLTSSIGYVPGDSYDIQQCSTPASVSAAGANVTVDWSTVSGIGSAINQAFVTPGSTPYASSFPSATVASAAVSQGGTTGYTYYNNSASKLELLGVATSQVMLPYQNPQTVFSFPIAYNNTYSDDFASDYSLSGFDVERRGTINVIADAYGTITTPNGTFAYLRLKVTQEMVDSIFMMGDFFQASTTSSVTYNYMNNALKAPVFSYSETFTSQGSQSSAYYYSGGATGIQENSPVTANESVYPNPAQNQVAVSFDLKSAEQLTFKVYDMTGKLVGSPFAQQLNKGQNTVPVNISSLSSGLYSVVVESANGSTSSLKFMVQ